MVPMPTGHARTRKSSMAYVHDIEITTERGPYRIVAYIEDKAIEWRHKGLAWARAHWSEISKTRRTRDCFEPIRKAYLYDRDFRILELF